MFAKFQKFQLDNLVDFEKFCKTRIYLQGSAPIQPKTSNFLPKICQLPYGSTAERAWALDGTLPAPRRDGAAAASTAAAATARIARSVQSRAEQYASIAASEYAFFRNLQNLILQIFGGLVLGCIKTKFCKKICV